jgi:hypothetical protein
MGAPPSNSALRALLQKIPDTAPLILAGDFNDWNEKSHQALIHAGLREAMQDGTLAACRKLFQRVGRCCVWIAFTTAISHCNLPNGLKAVRGENYRITVHCLPNLRALDLWMLLCEWCRYAATLKR